MFTRRLKESSKSFILLGPRGTGKSTWLLEKFKKAKKYDLLDTNEVLRLSRNPGLLFQELSHLKNGSWVVIDEIQKVPQLLNEVHRLIEQQSLKFALCGSSARKLKQKGTNLLAGRARLQEFYPLVSAEVNFKLSIPKAINFGMLPTVFNDDDPISYLRTYANVYLQEEIREEALTRNIGNFSRFLEVAARQNAQVTNISAIARDAQVARQTVQGYFEILIDTLLGIWLPAWKLKRATKQIRHPKFYFFDPGVARAFSERLPYPPLPEEKGFLLETLLLHELRTYLSYNNLHYPLTFWSSHDGIEVDFFLETKKGYVAIECKAASRWENKFQQGLLRIKNEISPGKVKTYGVYLGNNLVTFDSLHVFPLKEFLQQLWEGKLIV